MSWPYTFIPINPYTFSPISPDEIETIPTTPPETEKVKGGEETQPPIPTTEIVSFPIPLWVIIIASFIVGLIFTWIISKFL